MVKYVKIVEFLWTYLPIVPFERLCGTSEEAFLRRYVSAKGLIGNHLVAGQWFF